MSGDKSLKAVAGFVGGSVLALLLGTGFWLGILLGLLGAVIALAFWK